jgi:hypothetical protein
MNGGSLVSPIKRIILPLLAISMLSATFASAASAASPAWWRAGSPLKTGETAAIAETTEVATPFRVEIGSYGIQCDSVRLEGTFLEGEKTGKGHSIVLSGCTDLTQPSCEVATIKSAPLSLVLEGEKTEKFKLNFKPTSGTEVATVKISGSSCSFSKIVLTGSMACNYPKVETEARVHELEFTTSSGTNLKAEGTLEAKFTGLDDFWLVSEKNWSVK